MSVWALISPALKFTLRIFIGLVVANVFHHQCKFPYGILHFHRLQVPARQGKHFTQGKKNNNKLQWSQIILLYHVVVEVSLLVLSELVLLDRSNGNVIWKSEGNLHGVLAKNINIFRQPLATHVEVHFWLLKSPQGIIEFNFYISKECLNRSSILNSGESSESSGGNISMISRHNVIPTPDSQSASASPSDSGSTPSPLQVH